jgi:hypothetical protein
VSAMTRTTMQKTYSAVCTWYILYLPSTAAARAGLLVLASRLVMLWVRCWTGGSTECDNKTYHSNIYTLQNTTTRHNITP